MEEYSLEDFSNVLLLKNHLVFLSTSQLLEIYQDNDLYITFLDTLAVMSNIDSAFLLFADGDIIRKAKEIINRKRFSITDKEIKNVINSCISYLNEIESYDTSHKNVLKNNYLAYHEDCRKRTIDKENLFLEALGYDAVVYMAIVEGDMEKLKDLDSFVIGSINYFMEAIPEMFDNEMISLRTREILEHIAVKGWPFRKVNREYSKEALENFQKIKIREE